MKKKPISTKYSTISNYANYLSTLGDLSRSRPLVVLFLVTFIPPSFDTIAFGTARTVPGDHERRMFVDKRIRMIARACKSLCTVSFEMYCVKFQFGEFEFY